jgi:hypothetical protein
LEISSHKPAKPHCKEKKKIKRENPQVLKTKNECKKKYSKHHHPSLLIIIAAEHPFPKS